MSETISPRDYYGENPEIYQEHQAEAWQSYIDDLMSKGMTEEDAIEYAKENPAGP